MKLFKVKNELFLSEVGKKKFLCETHRNSLNF